MRLSFKRGYTYTRKTIGEICYPDVGRPAGGNWDTGYVRVGDNLIVFMNIGVPGRTGHDFENYFDDDTGIIVWYGKPKSHSGQPIFEKLIQRDITPHFFARWNTTPEFMYLGIGSILQHEDNVMTKHGSAIKLKLICEDIRDIIIYSTGDVISPDSDTVVISSSFAFEKHLEEYLYKNWYSTALGEQYSIYENGRQFQTDTGPLDILALKHDASEFLVVELKRDKASDVVVGQTLRYMGYIKSQMASDNQAVKGCIIATEEDRGLRRALSVTPNVDFYKYQINFSLEKVS